MSAPNLVEVSRMRALATTIHDAAAQMEKVLLEHHQPLPSFDEDSPVALPEAALAFQSAAIGATAELHDLLLDPLDLLYQKSSHYHFTSLQFIARFHVASMIPAGGKTSYAEIAQKTGLQESMVRRLLRHAMTMRIFHEPEPGMVAHTQASKLLVTPEKNAWFWFHPEVGWPASVQVCNKRAEWEDQVLLFEYISSTNTDYLLLVVVVQYLEATQKWPESQEANETGFSLAGHSGKSIYDVFSADPEHALRFSLAMDTFGELPQYQMSKVVEGYDWASLGRAKIVDVGGSAGQMCVAMARSFPALNFVVQDMASLVAKGQANLPPELEGRVQFMAHDFFGEQTVRAEAYLLRTVFHNWSDKYCLQILRALAPALQHGARILINDVCLPKPGSIPAHMELDMRNLDLLMGTIFNAQERDLNEWVQLLAKADPRFVFQRLVQLKGSALAIIEVLWVDNA
ncbi:S-adenosyl-L-methionine-dependent methyltransferase [Apiospora saccharicola]